MKEEFIEFVRELRGPVRSRRQEKIQEVELSWSASQLVAFRLFVLGLHPSELTDVCYALADARSIPLLEILGDLAEREPELMDIAFQSIEKTPQQAQLFLAKRLISSKKTAVRAKACRLLGTLGPQSRPFLDQALKDKDPAVLQAAIASISHDSLKNLGERVIPFLHNGNKNVRYAALGAIAHLGLASPALTDDLLAILQNSTQDEKGRRLAAGILARAFSSKARTILLDALHINTSEYILRLAAAESLSSYDDPEAIKAVLLAIDDKDTTISQTARMSLYRKNTASFAEILAKFIGDDNARLAELASEILGGLDAPFVSNLLINRLKMEKRIPVITALAKAMGMIGTPDAWITLIKKQKEEKIYSPAFFSALADVAEESNLPEFAAFFDEVSDHETKRVILNRLALFSRTSKVASEIESLAFRILNEPESSLHIPAAIILAHSTDLNPQKIAFILQNIVNSDYDSDISSIVTTMLKAKKGDLAEVFINAPPSAAGILMKAALEAASIGEKSKQLFCMVAGWARGGIKYAKEALDNMAFLAPAALVSSMAKCTDQIYLIEAWSSLPDQIRFSNYPDFRTFFANASPEDALACLKIFQNLQDLQTLSDVADVSFTSKHSDVRKAAQSLTRELVLA